MKASQLDKEAWGGHTNYFLHYILLHYLHFCNNFIIHENNVFSSGKMWSSFNSHKNKISY